jgi:chromosome segregation ATPase
MKVLTLTTIGTLAAVLAFSTGCSQSEIDALNTELADAHTALDGCQRDLAVAREAQGVAEREMTVAQDQSETAYVNLHKVQQQLTEQKQRADVAQAGYFQMGLQLTAKDKIISELKAQLSAALEHPPQ